MNVKRFTARTAREALALVRQALGDDAVVLSTRPGQDGVEVLAMAPDGMAQIEQAAAGSTLVRAARPIATSATLAAPGPMVATLASVATAQGADSPLARRIASRGERLEPVMDAAPMLDLVPAAPAAPAALARRSPGSPDPNEIADDVQTLGMSTLTFQDYVRERMLKRRQAELAQAAQVHHAAPRAAAMRGPVNGQAAALHGPADGQPAARTEQAPRNTLDDGAPLPLRVNLPRARREPPVLRDEVDPHSFSATRPGVAGAARGDSAEVMGELRSVRHLIEERFGMLAFMERLQRDPRQAGLSQKLFDAGLSPALVRKLVQALPSEVSDETAWAAGVLERNLATDEHDAPIEDHSGALALIGSTGVGKTTSTAKIAAAFASRHGASNLGLITLDAYRVAAHEQLRTYGRILGVPVHTAHDRASLEDLLELLSSKRLVLIDTAGMAQRDTRTTELLEMLSHPAIQKLLVVNAAAQGETVEDVMLAYRVSACRGVIVSKLDEAVKLGPALDALIRHKAKVVGVANGQRVPEDWHRLSAQALVQRALRGGGGAPWRLDAAEVNLVFAATRGGRYPGPTAHAAPLHA